MKFVLETGQNILIHAYDSGSISLKGLRPESPQIAENVLDEWDAENQLGVIRSSVLVNSDGSLKPWRPQQPQDLLADDFLFLAESNPEVVLIGTGNYTQFPPADCLAVLQQQNIGYEIMDTAAACRTYNVLMSEGRTVLLAVMMMD